MARPPLKQEQDFSWENEFESEEDLRSERLRPEEEARFEAEEDLGSQRFQPDKETRSESGEDLQSERLQPGEDLRAQHIQPDEIRFEERSPFDGRFLPHQPDTEPEQRPLLIWQADNQPKLARASRAAFLALLLVMAFGAGWALERVLTGPTTAGNETRAANESSPLPAPPPVAPEPDAAVADRHEPVASQEPTESAPANLPPAALEQPLDPKPVNPAAPSREDAPPPRPFENRPPAATPAPDTSASTSRSTAAARSTPAAADREVRQPPPDRRLNLAPPARPPYRSIPEPTPQRPAVVESRPPAQTVPPPSASPVTPPPSPAVTSSPSPAVEAPALPRVAVDDPEPRPPATPPAAPAPAAPPAATVAPPAPATAAPPAAASVAVDVDNRAIRDVLGWYRQAFNDLDAGAVQQVWPTVNHRTLDRAFGQLQEQSLSFDTCTIAVKGALAEAVCSGTTRFVPAVGNRSAQTQPRKWSFNLRKTNNGGWLIQNVEAR
jgi:hypothetical protein